MDTVTVVTVDMESAVSVATDMEATDTVATGTVATAATAATAQVTPMVALKVPRTLVPSARRSEVHLSRARKLEAVDTDDDELVRTGQPKIRTRDDEIT